ncbi:MAG: hypothetical protein J5821_02700 [Alphaproteobacteria bacterium]|nr:hypothetical protein [Alphaproteobacteria bacterium]
MLAQSNDGSFDIGVHKHGPDQLISQFGYSSGVPKKTWRCGVRRRGASKSGIQFRWCELIFIRRFE